MCRSHIEDKRRTDFRSCNRSRSWRVGMSVHPFSGMVSDDGEPQLSCERIKSMREKRASNDRSNERLLAAPSMAAFECDDWHRGQCLAVPLRGRIGVTFGVTVKIKRQVGILGNMASGIGLPEHQALLLLNPAEWLAYISHNESDWSPCNSAFTSARLSVRQRAASSGP